MMMSALPAPWSAVHDLQLRRSNSPPNSLSARAADHAAELVLSPRRKTGPYLAYNALRDARIIVLRRDRLENRRFPASFYGTSTQPDGLNIRHETCRSPLETAPSPADEIEAVEESRAWTALYSRIRAELEKTDPRLALIFDGWRDGETVKAAADRLGVSPGYVKKLRLKATGIATRVRAG